MLLIHKAVTLKPHRYNPLNDYPVANQLMSSPYSGMETMEHMHQKARVDGIDLIKVLAMLLVTVIHYIAYNDGLAYAQGAGKFFLTLLFTATCIGVNLFTVVTGYLLCDKEPSITRVARVWSEGWFYSVTLFLPGIVISQGGHIGIGDLIRIVFPVLSQHYWYLTMIVLIYLMSPVLNIVIKVLSEATFKRSLIFAGLIITVLFAANPFIPEEVYLGHPHGFLWLMYLYLLGAYIKLYLPSTSRTVWAGVAVICLTLIFLVQWSGFSITNVSLTSQYSVLPTLSTVAAFVLLKDAKLRHLKTLYKGLRVR